MTEAITKLTQERERKPLRAVSELVHLLWVTDEELIAVMGMPVQKGRELLAMYDRNPKSGFPQPQGVAGGRRYLPAVRAFFDKANAVKMDASPIPFTRRPNAQ